LASKAEGGEVDGLDGAGISQQGRLQLEQLFDSGSRTLLTGGRTDVPHKDMWGGQFGEYLTCIMVTTLGRRLGIKLAGLKDAYLNLATEGQASTGAASPLKRYTPTVGRIKRNCRIVRFLRGYSATSNSLPA
jgi:hypothetical protein